MLRFGLILALIAMVGSPAMAVDLPSEFDVGAQYDDTSTSQPAEDEFAFLRLTPWRAAHINLRNQSGTEIGTASDPVRIDPTGLTSQPVVGNVASGASDSGNPVKVGGRYNVTPPILTNGQRGDLQLTVNGLLKTDGTITSTVGSYVDQGAFAYGVDKFNPSGGIYQDTGALLTAGQVGVSRMTPYRGLHVNLRDNSGNEFATVENPLIIAPATSTGRFRFGDITSASLTIKAVYRTTYTQQTANAQRSIVSANANDTAAGTGARTVTIEYCTVAGVCGLSETVTLNGTTAVNTVATNICYIERMFVASVGSTRSNVGIITLRAATGGGGAVIGTIGATDKRTFWAHHYIDAAKTANISALSVSHNGTVVGSGGVFIIRAIPLNASNQVEQQVSDFVRLYGQSSNFTRTYSSPIPVVGPAKITVYVTPESASSLVYRGAIDFFEQ